jgi:LEA14-like dessication related protein
VKTLLFLSMLLLSACAAFVTKPEITLKDVKLVGLNSEGLDLDFYLSVYNPNSFDLQLKNYRYDVKIVSLPLAQGNSRTTYDFYSKSASELLIPVRIPYNGLIEVIKRRPNPDAVPYQLHAEMTVGAAVGNLTIPVNKSGTFRIPKEYRPKNVLNMIGDFINGIK